MTSEEILKSGNIFAKGLLLAFSIVYALYLTADHPIDANVIPVIGQHRADLQNALTSVEKIAPSTTVAIPPDVPTPSDPPPLKAIELREKIVKTYLDEAIARKAADVQYNVPGLPGSFSEKTVVLLFPLITFGATLRLWGYRRALLRAHDIPVSEFPFWAAPFCRPPRDIGFGKWLLLNTLGLTIIAAICVLTIEYILDTRERLPEPLYQSFALISLGLGIVCIATYGVALIRAMCGLTLDEDGARK